MVAVDVAAAGVAVAGIAVAAVTSHGVSSAAIADGGRRLVGAGRVAVGADLRVAPAVGPAVRRLLGERWAGQRVILGRPGRPAGQAGQHRETGLTRRRRGGGVLAEGNGCVVPGPGRGRLVPGAGRK